MLAVTVVSVRSLAESGQLASFTTAGCHRRFRVRDVERYAKANGLTLNRPSRSSYRVLIVDDDKSFANMLGQLLTSLPYEIDTEIAHNGFQAGFKAKQGVPDVILLDIMMPGVSGIEVAAALKEEPETNHIRIIGMTGGATNSSETKMISAGAEKVLRKPFDIAELLEAIDEEELSQFSKHVGT